MTEAAAETQRAREELLKVEVENASLRATLQEVRGIFVCPVRQSLCRNPVVASDGHTYDKRSLERWLRRQRTSPMTREPLLLPLFENRAAMQILQQLTLVGLGATDTDAEEDPETPSAAEQVQHPLIGQWIGIGMPGFERAPQPPPTRRPPPPPRPDSPPPEQTDTRGLPQAPPPRATLGPPRALRDSFPSPPAPQQSGMTAANPEGTQAQAPQRARPQRPAPLSDDALRPSGWEAVPFYGETPGARTLTVQAYRLAFPFLSQPGVGSGETPGTRPT